MITLIVLSFAILLAYTGAVIEKNGIPTSLSETYYTLEKPKIFTACMVGAAALMLPPALEVSKEASKFLVFLSVVGLIMVGIFPHFKTYEKGLHYTGSGILFVCSQIWVACNCWWLLLAWVACGVYTAKVATLAWKEQPQSWVNGMAKRHVVFWVEVTMAATVYLCALFAPVK